MSDVQEFKHNWLYSVVPAWSRNEGKIYLAGYCKLCDQGIAVEIPIATYNGNLINKLGVPKWGCIDPNSAEAINSI